jgi:2-dehydropantoate 2-reductase
LGAEGVTVNGVRFDFPVYTPAVSVEPADLLVVGVKYPQLVSALDQMAAHIGPDTIVISLLNGLTSEDEIALRFPHATVLYAITFAVDAVRQAHNVAYASQGKIAFGQAQNTPPYSPAVRRVAEIFDQCEIPYEIPEDMLARMWWKFMANVGVNQVTAALRSSYDLVQRPDSPARELMIAAHREVIAVAQAKGIPLGEADLDHWLTILDGLGPAPYTSMAQDGLANRPTETDIFAGAMRTMGAELGIPVPVNTVLHHLLKATEPVPSVTCGSEGERTLQGCQNLRQAVGGVEGKGKERVV